MIIQIRSPDAKSRGFYTRKQYFRCFRFISKQRCTVQGALWAKSTTSETELFQILPPWSAVINTQKGRAPAVEGIGNCADALSWFGTRRLSTWAPRVVFVWKPHWRPLQGQTSQRRCWSCLWAVPRFLFKNKYLFFFIFFLKVIENCHLYDFLLSQVFHGFLPLKWPPGWTCILGLVWWSW